MLCVINVCSQCNYSVITMVTSVFVYLLALVLCVTNPTNGTQYCYIVEVFVECGDVDQVFVERYLGTGRGSYCRAEVS